MRHPYPYKTHDDFASSIYVSLYVLYSVLCVYLCTSYMPNAEFRLGKGKRRRGAKTKTKARKKNYSKNRMYYLSHLIILNRKEEKEKKREWGTR